MLAWMFVWFVGAKDADTQIGEADTQIGGAFLYVALRAQRSSVVWHSRERGSDQRRGGSGSHGGGMQRGWQGLRMVPGGKVRRVMRGWCGRKGVWSVRREGDDERR
eukprot:2918085-Rhodomonas_salina.1